MHRTQEQYAEKPSIHPLFCFAMLHFLFSVCSKLNSSYFGDDCIPSCRLQSKHLLRIGNKTSWVKCTVQARFLERPRRSGGLGKNQSLALLRLSCQWVPLYHNKTRGWHIRQARLFVNKSSQDSHPGLESYIHISPDTEDKKSLLNGGRWGDLYCERHERSEVRHFDKLFVSTGLTY